MAFWPKKTEAPGTPPASPAAPVEPAATANVAPPAQPTAAAPPADPTAPAHLPPEALKNGAAVSKAIMAAFGQIVTVLMRTQEHRNKPLNELEWLVVPAVTTGQFALAEAQSKVNGMMAPVGLILWATVSAAVDQRLRADIANGVKLAPDEWKSGDHLWIVEAVGDPKILQAMLQRATQNEWKGRSANLRVRAPDGAIRVGMLSQKPETQA